MSDSTGNRLSPLGLFLRQADTEAQVGLSISQLVSRASFVKDAVAVRFEEYRASLRKFGITG